MKGQSNWEEKIKLHINSDKDLEQKEMRPTLDS
jgi:hypothetical protein